MTQHDETPAEKRAKGKDVDGLKTLPGVHSASGDEKAGSGDVEAEGDDPADAHVAGEAYPSHPAQGGPPNRHS